MASTDTTRTDTSAVKLTFLTMAGMVVGSMVGAGVFSLPRRFAQETGVYGALIAWLVAGTGMLMLAFVFQTLAIRKPTWTPGSTPTPRPASESTSGSSRRSATGPAPVWAT